MLVGRQPPGQWEVVQLLEAGYSYSVVKKEAVYHESTGPPFRTWCPARRGRECHSEFIPCLRCAWPSCYGGLRCGPSGALSAPSAIGYRAVSTPGLVVE